MTTQDGNAAVRALKTLEELAERGFVRVERGQRIHPRRDDGLWWVSVDPPIGDFGMFTGFTFVDVMDRVREVL